MKEKLQKIITEALKELGINAEAVILEHPAELSNGDYSTNAAFMYAKAAKTSPGQLANEIVNYIGSRKLPEIEAILVDTAGRGFVNFRLSRVFFAEAVKEIDNDPKKWGSNTLLSGKKVMVEYTQPNPFKPFHIGHLMSNSIGESISRIVEASGAKTIRANYQGDVGPHVAKAIWALMKKPQPEFISPMQSANYIGVCYAEGSDAYENHPAAKAEIDAINKKVYDRSDEEINEIYDWGRRVTLEAFEQIYATLGTKFDHYFFESEMAPIGAAIVRENVPKVFEESDGAIVFHGEKYDPKLHTRVFINSQGLPTYETKEIGLTMTKFQKENPDISIVTTAIEQGEYMKVVQKAISLIHPEYESRMRHITHGMMRFASGKMSSRKGNVVTGESLLKDAQEVVSEKMADRDLSESERAAIAAQVGVAALKYSILKQSLGGDIVYDFEKSISFDGDSGPYLQYTAVRAQAVLEKGTRESISLNTTLPENWQPTTLEKQLYRFPEYVIRAYETLEPHHIATYLTELASVFNSFYAETKIVDTADPTSPYKLALTQAFQTIMKNGLYLLGIQVPEKM